MNSEDNPHLRKQLCDRKTLNSLLKERAQKQERELHAKLSESINTWKNGQTICIHPIFGQLERYIENLNLENALINELLSFPISSGPLRGPDEMGKEKE